MVPDDCCASAQTTAFSSAESGRRRWLAARHIKGCRCCACIRASPGLHDRTRIEAIPPIKPHQMERVKRSIEAHVLAGIEHVAVLGH